MTDLSRCGWQAICEHTWQLSSYKSEHVFTAKQSAWYRWSRPLWELLKFKNSLLCFFLSRTLLSAWRPAGAQRALTGDQGSWEFFSFRRAAQSRTNPMSSRTVGRVPLAARQTRKASCRPHALLLKECQLPLCTRTTPHSINIFTCQSQRGRKKIFLKLNFKVISLTQIMTFLIWEGGGGVENHTLRKRWRGFMSVDFNDLAKQGTDNPVWAPHP